MGHDKHANPKDIVFNYSDIELTEGMISVLNLGLNYSILPLKLDITQVLVDFRRFERSAIWQEYWHGHENDVGYKPPIFKSQKNNLPKKHSTPKGLKTFLNSIKSEIMDSRNRNSAKCNLTPEQIVALKELIKMQRERKIIIKACDKGAGIIILNFNDYLRACYEHLLSRLESNGDIPEFYYKQVSDGFLGQAKLEIKSVLKEAYENNIITDGEFKAMDPEDTDPARFYCNFKVHKEHQPGTVPSVRPIISGSGSTTENIGKFVEHHINKVAKTHKSFIEDTPDFLREIEKINKQMSPMQDVIIATVDIKGAYQNIPQEDGVKVLYEALNEHNDKDIPSVLVAKLMELILKYNIFEFNGDLFQQLIGTAMGSKPAPSYANIYIAKKIDPEVDRLGMKYGQNGSSALILFKRFLDDLFLLFKGTSKQLHNFFEELNEVHPTLKFTLQHTSPPNECEEDRCDCEHLNSIPFLDTLCSIDNGSIDTDLYRKPTDRNQYLLPESCHSKNTCKSIPFSLGLRVVRICSKAENRDKRLNELKYLLMERGYAEYVIDRALTKARAVPRQRALLKRKNKENTIKRPIFAVKFDPRLPSLQAIQAKHWRAMTGSDQYLASVFPAPPLTAFKRQNNLRSMIIRAKVPKPARAYPERKLKGMFKCKNVCSACPYIKEDKVVKYGENKKWILNRNLTCANSNIIYMIECQKENCKEPRYIGESGRPLRYRLAEHRGYIVNHMTDKPTGAHFTSPGHSLSDMKIIILEQVKIQDTLYRKEREKYFIHKLNTYYQGMNRQQ